MSLSSSLSNDDWLDMMAGAPDIFGVSGSEHFDDRDRGDRDRGDQPYSDLELLSSMAPNPPSPPPQVPPRRGRPAPPANPRRKKRGKFRIAGKKFSLTWPKCNTEPQVVLDRIMAMSQGVKWAVVSREKHEDGTWHLHAAVWFKAKFDSDSPRCLDFLAGQHGDYAPARDMTKWLKYILKDNDYVSSPGFDPKVYLEARANHRSTSFAKVAAQLVKGKSIAEINVLSPGFVMQHLPKLKTYRSFLDDVGGDPLLEFPPLSDLQRDAFNVSELSISCWLETNLRGFPVRPPFRSKQLMIIGGSGIGKSSFVDALSKFARPYDVPMDENFYDSYDDKLFNMCIMDEFRSQKTITFLNKFVDGSPCPLRIKGGQTTKRKNLPVIVLSNWEPAISYCKVQAANPEVLVALLRRFLVVRVPADEDLYGLCTWLGRAED